MLTDEYVQHGFSYRCVDDLSTPWVPSPVSPPTSLPQSTTTAGASSSTTLLSLLGSSLKSSSGSPSSTRGKRSKKVIKFRLARRNLEASHGQQPLGRKETLVSLFRYARDLLRMRNYRVLKFEIEQFDPAELDPPVPVSPPVPLSEWKAWGYYAYPTINGVSVCNLSPKPALTVELDESVMFMHLKSPDGELHPERWIKGQKHPALPSKPTLWKPHNPRDPLPFPWEVQLNPFLKQTRSASTHWQGITPIYYNLTTPTSCVFYNTDNGDFIFVTDADLHQPATWPFLTHMYINGLAFEASDWETVHNIQWPIMVENRDGIICDDIFDGIFRSFQQYVTNGEFAGWSVEVQEETKRAYHERPKFNDGDEFLRRVDVLGPNIYFRGLAPNPNREGWVLLLGPKPACRISLPQHGVTIDES